MKSPTPIREFISNHICTSGDHAKTCVKFLKKLIANLPPQKAKKIEKAYVEMLQEIWMDGANSGYEDGVNETSENVEEEMELQYNRGFKEGYKEGHKKGLFVGRKRKVNTIYTKIL